MNGGKWLARATGPCYTSMSRMAYIASGGPLTNAIKHAQCLLWLSLAQLRGVKKRGERRRNYAGGSLEIVSSHRHELCYHYNRYIRKLFVGFNNQPSATVQQVCFEVIVVKFFTTTVMSNKSIRWKAEMSARPTSTGR